MIERRQQDGLCVVTLNRPDKANSLTLAMLEQLVEAVEDAGEARAFIITGRGRVFSAGADLDEVQTIGLATSPLWELLAGAIAALPCLSVAALNGTLAGGAIGMALACDLRIAVPSASIFYPVLKRSVLPQPSDPRRMAALIGPARTRLILLAGQKIPAEEAYTFGLIDRVVPPELLMQTAEDLVADTRGADPALTAAIDRLISGA